MKMLEWIKTIPSDSGKWADSFRAAFFLFVCSLGGGIIAAFEVKVWLPVFLAPSWVFSIIVVCQFFGWGYKLHEKRKRQR
jgi:hypothetical protein